MPYHINIFIWISLVFLYMKYRMLFLWIHLDAWIEVHKLSEIRLFCFFYFFFFLFFSLSQSVSFVFHHFIPFLVYIFRYIYVCIRSSKIWFVWIYSANIRIQLKERKKKKKIILINSATINKQVILNGKTYNVILNCSTTNNQDEVYCKQHQR